MEQTTAAPDRTVVEPESGKAVFVQSVESHPHFGPKTVLGGDTYDLLSRKGENLSSELDFNEHHLSWDGDFFEAWTMDVGSEHVEALREVVEAAGHSFGGVSADVCEAVRDMVPDDADEFSYWSEHDIRVRVTYESKQSGSELTKEGIVSSVAADKGVISFKRDDHKVNTLRGNGIYSQSSRYPYMGQVTKVEVSR